jgi:hypothetical protein
MIERPARGVNHHRLLPSALRQRSSRSGLMDIHAIRDAENKGLCPDGLEQHQHSNDQ